MIRDQEAWIVDGLARLAECVDATDERSGAPTGIALETQPGPPGRRARSVLAVAAVAAIVMGSLAVWRLESRQVEPQLRVEAPASTASVAPATSTTVPLAAPRFEPAPGWDVVQVEAVATASNIELGPSTRSGDAPWDTVERLEDGDVVLYAFFMPAGEKAVVDAAFPPGELPLSIDDALPTGLEGQPDDVTGEGLQVQVNGWNITVHIFYGGAAEPTPESRAAAQEQLARLDVPPR